MVNCQSIIHSIVFNSKPNTRNATQTLLTTGTLLLIAIACTPQPMGPPNAKRQQIDLGTRSISVNEVINTLMETPAREDEATIERQIQLLSAT